MTKDTLLFVGDAGCESGFAKCTHNTVPGLLDDYDVSVLGLNYRGDPDARLKYPYDIYPAWIPGGSSLGYKRIAGLIEKLRPSVVVLQNDPWNMPMYVDEIRRVSRGTVIVGLVAVDGLNCSGTKLNGLTRAIFWTEFGRSEAQLGGMTIPSGVVPLGVDLSVFSPGDKNEARKALGLPAATIDAFVVGNINRNQPRKRLDLSIRYFAEWMHTDKVTDAWLLLHVAPTGDQGYDCAQLARYYGVDRRLIMCQPEMYHGTPEVWVVNTMRALSVQFQPSQGEGWGLTTMEGMACGTAQVGTQWAAVAEWAADAALLVPCSATVTTPAPANAIGGIMDEERAVAALRTLYRSPETRTDYEERGLALVREPRFRWPHIASQVALEVAKARQQ